MLGCSKPRLGAVNGSRSLFKSCLDPLARITKVNTEGLDEIFAVKVAKARKEQKVDFEVLADVAVEFEKLKYMGPSPNPYYIQLLRATLFGSTQSSSCNEFASPTLPRNIIEAFALLSDGSTYGLVLPRASCSLSSHLNQARATMSQQARFSLAWQAFSALGHVHRHGMLHLDAKPGNMLLFPGDACAAAPAESWQLKLWLAGIGVCPDTRNTFLSTCC